MSHFVKFEFFKKDFSIFLTNHLLLLLLLLLCYFLCSYLFIYLSVYSLFLFFFRLSFVLYQNYLLMTYFLSSVSRLLSILYPFAVDSFFPSFLLSHAFTTFYFHFLLTCPSFLVFSFSFFFFLSFHLLVFAFSQLTFLIAVFVCLFVCLFVSFFLSFFHVFILVGWLVGWVLWHINLCRLFNTKSIFM